jgi:hypothetical protein
MQPANPACSTQTGSLMTSKPTAARTRMRAMIERLKAASVPYWRDEAAVILDDGAFQRAMRLVPNDEAQSLWVEFDAQMERVYAIWAATRSASS